MGLSLGFGGGLPGGGGTPASFEALAQAMVPPWASRMPSIVSSRVALTEVKASFVGDDGLVFRDADGGFVQGVAPANTRGTQTPVYPSQVSLAVTLDTAFKGAVGRGRYYVPGIGQQVLTKGVLTDAASAGIAGQMANFVRDVNAAAVAEGVGPVVIASGGSVVKSQAPALRPVTGIRVGSRLDVIRSRANALDERYAVVAL
jgi:hypothetical protein